MKNLFQIHCARWYIPILCVLLLTGQSSAADDKIQFERIASENYVLQKGLSQNSIYCIYQDVKGYMWFGTWDGLNMYDGYEFEVFRPGKYRQGNDISSRIIHCMKEDVHGNLWIGTEKGLNKFNRKDRSFQYYLKDQEDPHGLKSDTINDMLFDSGGNLWLATNNGLHRFDPESEKFRVYSNNQGNSSSTNNSNILGLNSDKVGKLWLVTGSGVSVFDPTLEGFTSYSRKSGSKIKFLCDTMNCVVVGNDDIIWLGSDRGLNSYDPSSGLVKNYQYKKGNPGGLSAAKVNTLLEDSQGRLWVGTEGGGLNLLDRESGEFTQFRYNANENTSLGNDYILSLFEDRNGTIWIGTNWKGVNKISSDLKRFEHYFHQSGNKNSLNNNLVWSIIEDHKGLLWIATDYGINILDRETGTFRFMRHKEGDPNTIVSDKVSYMCQDRDQNVWIGSFDHGLSRYDYVSKKLQHFTHDPGNENTLCSNDISCIVQDSNGDIWIGTDNGLCRYNEARKEFITYRNIAGDSLSLGYNQISSLYIDHHGGLWIGTYATLEYFDHRKNTFTTYKHDPENPASLGNGAVFCIYHDSKGEFWVGTAGDGLSKFDPAKEEFIHFTENDGLPNNIIYSIFEDSDGNLWMSTNFGLSMFNQKNMDFVNYGVKDGVQSFEFNLGAAFQNRNGEMFFGGMNGFNAFYPQNIRNNTNPPNIVITRLEILDTKYPHELSSGETIRLNYKENFLLFEFSALDYTNPSKNNYCYMLENYDNDWTCTDAENRIARYTKVNPGSYVFKVKASNNDGFWNEEGIEIRVLIAPAWWNTWMFRILFILLMVSLLWYMIYRRIKNIRAKHDVEKKMLHFEKEMLELKQKALQLQMNPHFIFNTMNSIQSFILDNDTDLAIHYLSKFSHLMRLILTNSDETFIPLGEEVKAITYYMDLEKLRFEEKFNYKIIIDPLLDDEFIEIPPMILQPYIENAIIHGLILKKSNGMIVIEARMEEKMVFWSITDNGIGRVEARKIQEASGLMKKSRGMKITHDRLRNFENEDSLGYTVSVIDLKDKAGNPCGTRVEVRMPYRET